MKYIDFKDIGIRGELAVRSGLNFARLEGQYYRPSEVFTADTHGWPGDWEGRVILAITLLGQATHRTPAYLEEILEELPKHFNEKRYLGKIEKDGVCDEQQLSGHSWLMRGLIEYYKWKKDPIILEHIEGILKNLFLEAKGKYRLYPLDPETRHQDKNWSLSKLQTKTAAHAETSDCGCAFIPLDGVTAAYELLRWPALKELADEMIQRFTEIDLVGLKVQTHATLSAIRGIIRMYEVDKQRYYLELAEKIFKTYKEEAWTEIYGNYNWFDHPRWTEPCGIVDSLMIAFQLWQHTGDCAYLHDAHWIYYNALNHAQRYNGSLGTDRCVGALKASDNFFLTPINFETYWCCSMRGGEGFSRAISYNYFIDGSSVYIPFYNSSLATISLPAGELELEQKSDYPYSGNISLRINRSTASIPIPIKFFVPEWSGEKITVSLNGEALSLPVNNGFVTVAGHFKAGDIIKLDLEMSPYAKDAISKNSEKDCYTFRFGPMILSLKLEGIPGQAEEDISDEGADRKLIDFAYRIPEPIKIARNAKLKPAGKGKFEVSGTPHILESLCAVEDLTQEDTLRQILFR